MRDLGALERMICAFLLLAIHVKNGLAKYSPTNMKCSMYNLSLYFRCDNIENDKLKVTSLVLGLHSTMGLE